MRPPRTLDRRSAWGFIVVLICIGLALYGSLTWRYRLSALIDVVHATIGTVATIPGAPNAYWAAVANLSLTGIGLYAMYGLGLYACWHAQPSRRLLVVIWGGAILAAMCMVAVYPVTSTDIFDYLFRGRIAAFYGKNPYIDLPNQFGNDPLFKTIGWPNAPSAYGPLWEVMSRGLARLGGTSLLRNVLLHKLLALLTYLGCGAAIVRITRPSGLKAQIIGSWLWLWSPLAIWEIVAVGHNDGLLVLTVLLAVWATEAGRIRWAVVALTIGTLLKFLPIILLPLVVIYGMRGYAGWWARLRLLVESILIFAVTAVLAYLPYWSGPRTLSNITVRDEFVTSAPLAVVSYWLREAPQLQRITDLLVRLHLPNPADTGDILVGVSRTASLVLAVGLLWQIWQVWRHGRGIWQAVFGLFLWYLTLGNQWFQPWYVLWLLGLIALRPAARQIAWISVWSLAGQTSYLLQYFIQPRLQQQRGNLWSGQGLRIQILYCLIIFVPPLIVWAVTRRTWRGSGRRNVAPRRDPERRPATT